MAEDVVEDVGVLEVVELSALADELACREAPIGEMFEEHLVGNEARYRDDWPPGMLHRDVAQPSEVRDLVGADRQVAHPLQELLAGTAGEQLRLTLEQRLPDGMLVGSIFLPALIDGPVGPLGPPGLAGLGSVFCDLRDLSLHHDSPPVLDGIHFLHIDYPPIQL